MASIDQERLNKRVAVSASHYDFKELAEIYNQTRIDYIVPMPMNARRMQDYVHNYDIRLDLSIVALNDVGAEAGIGMLGIRGERGWITRLGVIPNNRGLRLGQFLMEEMIEKAQDVGATQIQLEVIVGNDPARGLFEKLGFKATRKLLIIRRPPGKISPDASCDNVDVRGMATGEIPYYLEMREQGASWVEETSSLLNAGKLKGLIVDMPNGETGWAVFQSSPFQLSHFVLSESSENTIRALLYHIHKQHAMQDTKIENVPETHPTWAIFQQMGYMEVFARTEMTLQL